MGDRRVGEWGDLPTELLPMIGRCLQHHFDCVRFRSVCKSWRSSLPPHPNSPSFPIKFPLPLHRYENGCSILTQTTFYRIDPPHNTQPTSYSSSSSKGWLIQVQHSNSLPMRLFHPLSNHQIMNPPRLWDLLHFGVLELYKSYTLQYQNGRCPIPSVRKVVFFPISSLTDVEDYVVFCIIQEGKLLFMRYGDENWSLVDNNNFHYDDVIVYKGQFYVVDRWGIVFWIDVSSLKLVQYSPPLVGSGGKKDIVESCGSLYVVERYYEGEAKRGTRHMGPEHDAQVVDFRVYKLDEELGKWVDVKSLGDRVLLLGDQCNFSVLAEDFAGYHHNCIYFFDFNHARMYNLDNGSIVKVGSHPSSLNLFWPPPSWMRI